MMNRDTGSPLHSIATALAPLADLVSRSFGPFGSGVLLSGANREISLTRSGADLLRWLSLEHPVSRLVTAAALAHHAETGDGASAFILAVNGAIHEASSTIKSLEDCIALRRELEAFALTTLPEIVRAALLSAIKMCSTKINKHSVAPSVSVLTAIIHTHLGGRLDQGSASILAPVLAEAVLLDLDQASWSCIKTRLATWRRHLQLVIVEDSSGKRSSCAIPGILVQRKLLTTGFDGDKVLLKRQNGLMALLGCRLETNFDEIELRAQFNNEDTGFHQLQRQMVARSRRCDRILTELSRRGTRLLLCTCVLNEFTLGCCSRLGIEVCHALSDDELQFVAEQFGTVPLGQIDHISAVDCHLVELEEWAPITVGDTPSTWMVPSNTAEENTSKLVNDRSYTTYCTPHRRLKPVTVVVAAATTAVSRYQVQALRETIQLLSMWAESSDDGRYSPKAIVPACGTVEFSFSELLIRRPAKQCGSSVIRAARGSAAAVIAAGFAVVPATLKRNSGLHNRRWYFDAATTFQTSSSPVDPLISPSAHSFGDLLITPATAVEPGICKVKLIQSVVTCLIQILRTEMILSFPMRCKKQPKPT